MKTRFITIMLCSLMITFFSCNKDENMDAPLPEIKADVSIYNGMLIFKDAETFNKAYAKVSLMEREESENWENQYGFVSQRSIFNKIVEAEDKYDLKCRELSLEEQVRVKPHSETYYKYLNSGFIKLVDEGTEDEIYDYSTCEPSYACFLNEQGLVMIADTIYQYSANHIKAITDGDLNKISKLNQVEGSNDKNILVTKVKTTKIDLDHKPSALRLG